MIFGFKHRQRSKTIKQVRTSWPSSREFLKYFALYTSEYPPQAKGNFCVWNTLPVKSWLERSLEWAGHRYWMWSEWERAGIGRLWPWWTTFSEVYKWILMPCVTHAARCCGRPRSLLVQSGWCHSSFPIRSGHVPVSGVGETLLLEVSTLNAHAVHRH